MSNAVKIIKKIVNGIFDLLVIIIVIFTLVIGFGFIQTNLFGKLYPNVFGYSAFEVITGSMANTLQIGDVIITKIQDAENLAINDIIVYRDQNTIVTHRLIDMKDNIFITKGDANNSLDTPITKDNVIGKVVFVIPQVGIWKRVFATPQVYIPLIITVLLLLFAFSCKTKKTLEE